MSQREAVRIKYQTSHEVGDKVLSSSVKSLVKSFDANRNEVERLRKRIVSRSLRVMQVLYRRGEYRPMVRQALDSIRLKEGASSEGFEEAKRAIVKLVESPDEDINTLVSPKSCSNMHERKGALRSKLGVAFQKFAAILCSPTVIFLLVGATILALLTLIIHGPSIGLKKWAEESGDTYGKVLDYGRSLFGH